MRSLEEELLYTQKEKTRGHPHGFRTCGRPLHHIPVVEVTHLRTSVMWCMGVESSVAHDAIVTVRQNRGMKEAMFAGRGATFMTNRNLNGMRSVSVWLTVSQ
jgi:hypothetical protein